MGTDIQVTLNWPGKCPLGTNALPLVPALREVWGASDGQLYHADCMCVPQLDNKPRLVYIDPPFDMGEQFPARIKMPNGDAIVVPAGFKDNWGVDGCDYLSFMYHRLIAIREWMHPDGLLCVHIDQHANSRIRLLLDEVFGRKNFVNEIIWSYRSGGGSKKALGHKHDTLYIYRKGTNYTFNQHAVRVPYDANIATKRQHMFNPDGKVSGDVWDISRPPNHSKEWLGYPTQKPIALLERLMCCYSNEGDLVADPFCGSGSWLAVAHQLGRKWVGMDVGTLAVHVTRKRMLASGASFCVHNADYPVGDWSYTPSEDTCTSFSGYHPTCLQQYPELAAHLTNEADCCDMLAEGQLCDDCFHVQRYALPGAFWTDVSKSVLTATDALAFDILGYAQSNRK